MNVNYYDWDEIEHNDNLHFFYDAQSRPAMVKFNGTLYTYVHNLQGDIVGILDSAGSLVVEYKYDAWGKPISITGSMSDTLGKRNPFRYRGYIYDEETGLYYLRSRYYNTHWDRIINPDDLFSANLFMYCQNNPICFDDQDGSLARNAIHNAVQRDIKKRYPDLICEAAVIKGTGGSGRIDLLRESTGEIWEIKPNTRSSYYHTGVSQLRNYVNGHLVNNPMKRLRIGGSISAGMFTYNDGQNIAFVKYWYTGNGIILYSYVFKKKLEPRKTSAPVPIYDREKKDITNSNSRPQAEIIPFPTPNEEQDDNIAAIAVVCVAAVVLIGASCITGIPFWAAFAF